MNDEIFEAFCLENNPFHFQLRAYPPNFGLKMVRLFPRLTQSRTPPPEVPEELMAMPTQEFFNSLPWDEDRWEDAGLISALSYLRGNKSLDLQSWRPHFPEFL